MPTTVISTNQTSAAILYTITAADDTYILLPGVTAVATSLVFYSASAAHTSLLLAGTVVSSSYVAIITGGNDANVTVAETGLVIGNINIPGFYAVGLQGTNNRLTNHGQILTTNDIAVYMTNTGASVTNTGLISGGQMGVLFGSTNSTMVNSGTISATYSGSAVGVDFGSTAGGTLDNSGQITADGAGQSAGVLVEADTLVIRNTGLISGTDGTGIEMTFAATNLTLYNSGIISGTLGSLNLAAGLGCAVTNRGTLIGNVTLTAGNDFFDGIGGQVTGFVTGGLGEDVYRTDTAGLAINELVGGGGSDRVESTVDFDLGTVAEVEDLTLIGNALTGSGNVLANTLVGNFRNNVLGGGAGRDTLFGHGGNDGLRGDADFDYLAGGDGDDSLIGGAGSDTLFGGEDYDTLLGGTFGDRLNGEGGEDVLVGGAGRDTLNGGAEADTYVFRSVSDSGASSLLRDSIVGFETGLDLIDLTAIDANSVLNGNQAFTYIGTGAFTNVAGQLRAVHGSNSLLQADVNGDGVADFEVTLASITSVDGNDLLL